MSRQDTPRMSWSQFYWSDWTADENLGLCSLAARGLWVELLALMARSARRGYLLVAGSSPDARAIQKLGRIDTVLEVEHCLEELKRHGVCSFTDDGIMYSRRMVRDVLRHARNQENGRQGGNPRLSRSDNPVVNPPVNGVDKPIDLDLEARSRNQREKDQKNRPRKTRASSPVGEPPEFTAFYEAFPKRENRPGALMAWRRHVTTSDLPKIEEALSWQRRQPRWVKDNGEFIPAPAKWLSGKRWTDEPFHPHESITGRTVPDADATRRLIYGESSRGAK